MNVGRLAEPESGRAWDPDRTRREVAARAARFEECGVRAGDRVFLLFGNRLEFFAELLAVWSLGGCAIPVDSRLTTFEVENLARTASPRCAVVHGEIEAKLADRLAAFEVTVLEAGNVRITGGDPAIRPGARLDDDALILFTSGSTGAPKGVVHTHRSLRARWITLRQSLGLDRYRRTLCLLPTHFGHGLICNCLFPWLSGQDLFIAPPFRQDWLMRLGSLVDEHEITFLSSVPSMWRLTLKVAKPPAKGTLERVHVGSAPLSAHLWREIQDWSGINEVFNAYGITETGSWVAGTTGGTVVPEDGLIGEPWGAVVRVLKSAEPMAVAEPGQQCSLEEVGYVWLNTPALMRGYFDRDDLTACVVSGGWFLTGDIGLLDARGRLVLKGRERDEINRAGLKIYPADIDAVVERFAKTTDVCTFGYEDPVYGQGVAMAVTLRNADDETTRALHAWIKDHLAEHKMPVRWYVVDEIPRTSRGKINRDTVAETCAGLEPLELTRILRESGA